MIAATTCSSIRRDIIERLDPMGLLPCLRRGSDRWWLPRSEAATVAIGHLLLATGRGQIDRSTRQLTRRTLAEDPPLLIFAALSWPGETASISQLADWLAENAIGRFASGDAFFAAPTIDSSLRQQWRRLWDHFRTVPNLRWLEDAPLWLEVSGPTVSDPWRDQWPRLVPDGEEKGEPPVRPATGDNLLQQLARMMQRQRSLEQSFDVTLHRSKMGALKQLAYGLSHEINNPLANISNRAQQLQRGEQDPTRSAILQRIVDQVYRAHEMIADLMFYANPSSATPSECDLNEVISQVADDFREEAERQAIRLEVQTAEAPTIATVDGRMIGEAVRALLRNSIDAIGCQGTIVVSLARHPGRLMIHVADSGPGVSEIARRHAFDPYYSGREAGRGLGLGLCRAYRIARLHQGEISLAGGPAGCVATITLHDGD